MILSNTSNLQKFSVIVIAGITITLLMIVTYRVYRHVEATRVRVRQLAVRDQGELDSLVSDVSAIAEKLGRVPNDERELEELLGESLPAIHVNNGRNRMDVVYVRKSNDSYYLQYLSDTGSFRYDSDSPEDGWFKLPD